MTENILYRKILRPNRALDRDGQKMAIYIVLFLLLFLAPALLITGFWVLLLFLFSPVVFLVFAFMRRNRDSRILEILEIRQGELRLEHYKPNGEQLEFVTDPYWVKIAMEKQGPVQDYLTLKDHKRCVELGAFLSPEERRAIYDELKLVQNRLHFR